MSDANGTTLLARPNHWETCATPGGGDDALYHNLAKDPHAVPIDHATTVMATCPSAYAGGEHVSPRAHSAKNLSVTDDGDTQCLKHSKRGGSG